MGIGDRQRSFNFEEVEPNERIRIVTDGLQRGCVETHRLRFIWVETEEISSIATKEVSRHFITIGAKKAISDVGDRESRRPGVLPGEIVRVLKVQGSVKPGR